MPAPPQQIVQVGDGLDLRPPGAPLPEGVRALGVGYRYTPTHGEWALMLRPHAESSWYEHFTESLREGSLEAPDSREVERDPVLGVVIEPNRMVHKGGSPVQVSAYLLSEASTFEWTPTVPQLHAMLQHAHSLYGWHGPTGLAAEIFQYVTPTCGTSALSARQCD